MASMQQASGRVFLSYRREDTQGTARHLRERLVDRLGADRVFMDIDSIEIGVDFTKAIVDAVSVSDVFLALIGRRWVSVVDEQGQRRLDRSGDFVVLEIATALARGIRVIPVLVDGADMPRSSELPPSIESLAVRNAIRLSHESFRSDVNRLLDRLTRLLDGSATPAHQRPTGGRVPNAFRDPADDVSQTDTSSVEPHQRQVTQPSALPARTPEFTRAASFEPVHRSEPRPRRSRLLVIAALLASAAVVGGVVLVKFVAEGGGDQTNSSCGALDADFTNGSKYPQFATAHMPTEPEYTRDGLVVVGAPGSDVRTDFQGSVTAAFVSIPVRGDFTLETSVTVDPTKSYQAAGLLIMVDQLNYVRLERGHGTFDAIAFEFSTNGEHVKLTTPFANEPGSGAVIRTSADAVDLRLQRNGSAITGEWRTAGARQWEALPGSAQLVGEATAGMSVLNTPIPSSPLSAVFRELSVVCAE
ncbi:TIR domain-containing protein [Nocardia sp. NPDC127606]|uniref:TIR domain-containing protein n=1 Tax=Nocardia sp. NPDC127606 TaxID=3345406 RepID=UPI003630C51A